MQQSFSHGLGQLIGQHAHHLSKSELLALTTSLCNSEAKTPTIDLVADRGVPATVARFTDLGVTIQDRQTDLIWTKAHVGDGKLDFKSAEKAVANLQLDSVGGWRLPTIRELLTLVDYERHDPAISPIFECKADWYWTSTPAAFSPADYAWVVNFDGGGAYWVNRGNHAFVRAVRPSQ